MNAPALVAVTGGPGAGKTAVLEVVRLHFSGHVAVLNEAAGIVFGGGFPRRSSPAAHRAAQRAIFRVQRELERLAIEEDETTRVVLCDRGTVDGAAYWPGEPAAFWEEFGVTRASELARYRTVIHLRPPADGHGYNHDNAVRIESAAEARRIDERIAAAWEGHPRRFVVESCESFTDKLTRVLALLRAEIDALAPGATLGLRADAASAPALPGSPVLAGSSRGTAGAG